MNPSYWHKQTKTHPLFPDLLWSRPENKAHAGKLLIIGGNSFGFALPAEAYMAAGTAGIGSVKVVLPQAVKKVTDNMMPSLEYASSTPSGSFGQQALGELLDLAAWADGVLFAGDMGRNSETAILMEGFLSKYSGLLTLVNDAVDFCLTTPNNALHRPDTLLVCSMAQLQKLGFLEHSEIAITHNMDLLRLIDALHTLTKRHKIKLIVSHESQIVVADNGQISTTPHENTPVQGAKLAAITAVWWLQNPTKSFEALTAAISQLDLS